MTPYLSFYWHCAFQIDKNIKFLKYGLNLDIMVLRLLTFYRRDVLTSIMTGRWPTTIWYHVNQTKDKMCPWKVDIMFIELLTSSSFILTSFWHHLTSFWHDSLSLFDVNTPKTHCYFNGTNFIYFLMFIALTWCLK